MDPQTVTNRAMPVHHTATVDEPWDGPAAVKAMPNKASVLYYCHAWQDDASVDSDTDDNDEDADDKKSNYKFPHHKTKGGAANVAACRNGLARLEASKIPEADKAGVKKHLQAHLDDAAGDESASNLLVPRYAFGNWAGRARSHTGRTRGDWYKIRNQAGTGVTEVMLYDEIGFWGVTAQDLVNELNQITSDQILLRINCYGGSVFDGIAIYNALASHDAEITARIEGIAASAASFIAMAGDTVEIYRNAQMMIHDAQGVCIGPAAEMRALADDLDKASDNIADIYTQKAGGTVADWRARMLDEITYSADEAVDLGLADRVISPKGDDMSNLFNTPFVNRRTRTPRSTSPASTVAAKEDEFVLPDDFNFADIFAQAFKEVRDGEGR